MKIGELAHAANCSTETIRYYEKAGLLPPPSRSESNYRQYTPAHLERLRLIRNCRSLDMSHEEIRGLLQALDASTDVCEPVNRLLDEHIGHHDQRIRELAKRHHDQPELRQRCTQARSGDRRGITEDLSAMDAPPRPGYGTHLG